MMTTLVSLLWLSAGACFAASPTGPLFDQAPATPEAASYQRLKAFFDAASRAPAIEEFPVENAPGLQCVMVNPKGGFVATKVIRLPRTSPAHGPLFSPTVEDRLVQYSYGSNLSTVYDSITQTKTELEIVIEIPKTPEFSGSPCASSFRKGEYVFLKNSCNTGPLYYGYCWHP